MRLGNPTRSWTSDNICHLKPDILTSPALSGQFGQKTDHNVPSVKFSQTNRVDFRFYCEHFYHQSYQTEESNYLYFVALPNLLTKEVTDLFKTRLTIRRKEEFILRAWQQIQGQDGLLKPNVKFTNNEAVKVSKFK